MTQSFYFQCLTLPERRAEPRCRAKAITSSPAKPSRNGSRRGEFLEWAEVFGNYYGTHRSVLDRAIAEDRDVVLDIDVQGARQLKEAIPDAVSIFILAPSREVLEKRLRSRSEDAEA